MSKTLRQILNLVRTGEVRISEHGYNELAADGLFAREITAGVASAALVEDYPDYPKGPCVLVLQWDQAGRPVHALWGIPKGEDAPAVLVTANRPDSARWTADFMRRK